MSGLGAIGEGLVELAAEPGGDTARIAIGGDAANVCVMASRLGTPTRLLGRVGDDVFGDALTDRWQDEGVETRFVRTDTAAATGIYLNQPTTSGAHRFIYWRNGSAGSRLEPADLQPEFFDGLQLLVVTGVTLAISESAADTAELAVEHAQDRDLEVACILNHRPGLGGDKRRLIELALSSDFVIGSQEDLTGLFGDPAAAVEELAEPASGREVSITAAESPARVWCRGQMLIQQVPVVRAENAACGGDAFAGAYLAARIQAHPVPEALRWAVAAASLSVQRPGCAGSYPTSQETAATAATLAAPGQSSSLAPR